jgi:hypothetical protein
MTGETFASATIGCAVKLNKSIDYLGSIVIVTIFGDFCCISVKKCRFP